MDFRPFIEAIADFAFFFEVDVAGFFQDDKVIHRFYFSRLANASFVVSCTHPFGSI